MVTTQAQLQKRTLTQQVRSKQQQQQLAELQKQVARAREFKQVISPGVQGTPQQQAYETLNKILNKAISRGQKVLKGTQITNIRQAFSSAGLDPNLGESLYKKGMTAKGTAYAGAKAGMTGGVYIKGFEFQEGKGYVYVPGVEAPAERVYPSTFVGPIEPGATRAPPPKFTGQKYRDPNWVERGNIYDVTQYTQSYSSYLKNLPKISLTTPQSQELSRQAERVYPSTFVGPIEPGARRAEPPPSRVYPSTFVGPIEPGARRAPPPTPMLSFLQPQFETSAQQEFYRQYVAPSVEQLKFEQKRYQELGYTVSEARKLAEESFVRGGFTFTPEGAAEIIKEPPTIPERVWEKVEPVIAAVPEIPFIKKVLEFPIYTEEVAPTYVDPFGFKFGEEIPERKFTIEGAYGGISRGLKLLAEKGGEEAEEVSRKFFMIFPELQPTLIIPGKEEEYKEVVELYKEGEITPEEARKRGKELTEEITPKQIGKVAEISLGIGAYVAAGPAIPILLTSDIVAAQQDYKNASALAQKEAEKALKEYRKEPIEEGYEQVSDEEYLNIVLPQFETEIKNQALMAIGISGAFLVGGALWKVGSALRKYVPRRNLMISGKRNLSQAKYDKIMKQHQEIQAREIDIFKIRGEREAWGAPKTIFDFGGKGVSREVVGTAGKIEVSTFSHTLSGIVGGSLIISTALSGVNVKPPSTKLSSANFLASEAV